MKAPQNVNDIWGLVGALQAAEVQVQPAALKALENFANQPSAEAVVLRRRTLEQLGCSNISGDKVCKIAEDFRLRCCPIERVLSLRLECDNQPRGEYIRMPAVDSDGKLWMFVLYNQQNEGVSISAYDVRTSDQEQSYYEFIFAEQA